MFRTGKFKDQWKTQNIYLVASITECYRSPRQSRSLEPNLEPKLRAVEIDTHS